MTVAESKRIDFGIMLQGPGGHMNAWRHDSVPVDASVNFSFFIERARQAEALGVSFLFVADGLYINERSIPHFLNRFEPLTVLSALAASTSDIGLVGTVSTSYSEPFTVARQFASLDLISGGRAGWNVVTSPLEGSAKNYGKPHPEHALRYQIAEEHLNVVKGLWDSWEDDAFVRDRSNAHFADLNKLHRLDHHGRFFNVEGPLNAQRSRQGQPVIFQAGSSDSGIRLAALHADAVFTNTSSLEDSQAFYRRLKQEAVDIGRDPEEIKIYPGIGPIVGKNEQDVVLKLSRLRDLLTIDDALNYLGRFFDHHDFSQYPLDESFPELGDIGANSFRSTTDRIKRSAREGNLTLREVAFQTASPRPLFAGTVTQVADDLEYWIDNGAADGFILGFPVIGEGLDDFENELVPELERRGRFQRQRNVHTLRGRLGLPFKQSRYAHEVESV